MTPGEQPDIKIAVAYRRQTFLRRLRRNVFGTQPQQRAMNLFMMIVQILGGPGDEHPQPPPGRVGRAVVVMHVDDLTLCDVGVTLGGNVLAWRFAWGDGHVWEVWSQ